MEQACQRVLTANHRDVATNHVPRCRVLKNKNVPICSYIPGWRTRQVLNCENNNCSGSSSQSAYPYTRRTTTRTHLIRVTWRPAPNRSYAQRVASHRPRNSSLNLLAYKKLHCHGHQVSVMRTLMWWGTRWYAMASLCRRLSRTARRRSWLRIYNLVPSNTSACLWWQPTLDRLNHPIWSQWHAQTYRTLQSSDRNVPWKREQQSLSGLDRSVNTSLYTCKSSLLHLSQT